MWAVGSAALLRGGFAALLIGAFVSSSEASAAPRETRDAGADIYANIPELDDQGRDQRRMFRLWNPDPIGSHEANLDALDPRLSAVVRRVQAEHPDLRFVVGSGRRSDALQKAAFRWGWSRTLGGPHQTGDAVDLWPLDAGGRVTFDPAAQDRVAVAVRKTARELGIPLRWGGTFMSFKRRDRSHFELAD